MATSYTSLLGFALPVTGELQGTWGDTVNNSITQLCEDSIAGVATASVLSSDWTLTTTGAGAANQARMAILIPTGSPGVSRNIIAPSKSKTYTVINQSNAAVVIKGAATTGVSVASGDTVIVAWNGSDFVAVKNADGTFTNLTYTGTLTGSTGVMNIGSGQLYKDASGNVGIGTSSPAYKLEVRGGVIAGGNGTIVGGISYSTRPEIGAISNHPVGFITSNTTRMIIDTSGNVGIGVTPSPFGGGALEMGGGQIISMQGAANFASNAYYNAGWKYTTSTYASYYSQSSGQHQWYTAPSGTAGNPISFTQAMTLDASGNMGIGTTTPSTKLQIDTGAAGYGLTLQASTQTSLKYQLGIDSSSNFNIYDTSSAAKRLVIDSSGNVGIGTTAPGAQFSVNKIAGQYGATAPSISTQYTGLDVFKIYMDSSWSTHLTAIQNGSNLSALAFDTNNSERMRIDSSGNVGIGTSSPSASAILDAQSTSKGVRFPNMTTTQKNAIASPSAGLVVFDTTLAKLCVYSGSAWQTITSV